MASVPLPTPELASSEDTAIDIEEDDAISEYSTLTVPMEVKFRDSIMSSKSSISTVPIKPKFPDGGWGWIVVLASLIISLIQDGISFSLGGLYSEFENEFKAPSSATSGIGALFLAVPLLSGPLMSALVDKYGCRSMTIVGGLVAATGFIISSFAQSIGVMFLTFGIISGLGLGLTYITVVVSIAFWFDKKRNLAVGLGACGTGIGTFVYAPFTSFLVESFGWRQTVNILAGTLLCICICGALMRDPDWIKEQNATKSSRSSKASSLSLTSTPSEKNKLEEVRNLLKSGENAEFVLQNLATSIQHEDQSPKMEHHHQSVLNLPTFVKQNETIPVEVLEQLSANKKIYNIILENYPTLLHCRSTSEKDLNKMLQDSSMISRIPVTVCVKLKKSQKAAVVKSPTEEPLVTEPLVAKVSKNKTKIVDKMDTKTWLVKQFSSTNPHPYYFKNMRFPRHSLRHHRGALLNKNKYRLRASSCPNIYRVSLTTLIKDEDERWYKVITDSFDFSPFLEFHFFLMSISTILLFSCFMTPFLYLTDHLEHNGFGKTEASYVTSVIGIANTIGMVILGWAGDQPWVNVIKTCGVCLIFCGLCCSALMFFTMNYILLIISAALYGIFLASSFSFTPVILVELLPLDSFTKAYGLQLLCQGLGHIGGPPFAGLLKDLTHTWTYPFHFGAGCIIASGLLILIIPYTKNRKMIGSGPVEKELANEKA